MEEVILCDFQDSFLVIFSWSFWSLTLGETSCQVVINPMERFMLTAKWMVFKADPPVLVKVIFRWLTIALVLSWDREFVLAPLYRWVKLKLREFACLIHSYTASQQATKCCFWNVFHHLSQSSYEGKIKCQRALGNLSSKILAPCGHSCEKYAHLCKLKEWTQRQSTVRF
jgi:hypothetical protein